MQKAKTAKTKLAHSSKKAVGALLGAIEANWEVQRAVRSVAILLIPVIVIAVLYIDRSNGCTEPYRNDVRVSFSGTIFQAERASSQDERTRGLSGRRCIEQNKAMLFEFDTSEPHGIWMKDMNFPIDIIWLDESKTIVHIERIVDPSTYPEIFRPNRPARYVVEIQSGASLGSAIGDRVSFSE